jgi:hypothetical protein
MSAEQTEAGQSNRESEVAGVEADSLHSAIAAILKEHPDGLTPAEIIDGLHRRQLAGEVDERSEGFALRVVSNIVKGGFRVKDGKYFLSARD